MINILNTVHMTLPVPEEKLLALIKSMPTEPGSMQGLKPGPSSFLVYFLLRLAIGAALCLCICAALYMGAWITRVPESSAEPSNARPSSVEIPPLVVPADTLEGYRSLITARQLFQNYPVQLAGTQKEIAKVSIAERTAHLVLSGIVMGQVPKAILEDKKIQKSYYVREGESVGECVVTKIDSGRVTLEFEGKTIDVTL